MQLELFIEHEDLGAGEGKVCSKCDTYLPLTAFSPSSGANFLRPECRTCNNELTKVRNRLREEYGMPPEGYICPICNCDEGQVKGKGNTKNGSWVLDHCHESMPRRIDVTDRSVHRRYRVSRLGAARRNAVREHAWQKCRDRRNRRWHVHLCGTRHCWRNLVS